MRRYVGRKADQLEHLRSQVVGNYGRWHCVFGGGEEHPGDRIGEGEHGRVELRE
jgi:hypothetical protein